MTAFVTLGPKGATVEAGAELPVGAMLAGRPVGEAAEILPRLFNLCRVAQGVAVRLALGLPDDGGDAAGEIVQDHVAQLCVTLPLAFGLTPLPLPADPVVLVGAGGLPATMAGLPGWDSPAAALALQVDRAFPAGMACCSVLPAPPGPLVAGAFENSAAGRQAAHPLLRSVERARGRGPLWRYMGLVADLDAALRGRLPAPRLQGGVACVTAARGAYALRIDCDAGRVTGVVRRTPTDHMLAPGGALAQALSSLPPALRHLAPQVIALHDPCVAVTLREVADA